MTIADEETEVGGGGGRMGERIELKTDGRNG